MAHAAFLTVLFNANGIESGNGLVAAKFAAQDTREDKADKRAVARDFDMNEIFWVLFCMCQPLFEEPATRRANVSGIDGDYSLEIGRAQRTDCSIWFCDSNAHAKPSHILYIFLIEPSFGFRIHVVFDHRQ